MTQTAYTSRAIYDSPAAISLEALRPPTTRPAAVERTKSTRASRTKAERVSELRKLVGPGRRITAVLRRANGRFIIYTEPDTSDRTPDISQPDSLKQSYQPFIDVPLGAANTIG